MIFQFAKCKRLPGRVNDLLIIPGKDGSHWLPWQPQAEQPTGDFQMLPRTTSTTPPFFPKHSYYLLGKYQYPQQICGISIDWEDYGVYIYISIIIECLICWGSLTYDAWGIWPFWLYLNVLAPNPLCALRNKHFLSIFAGFKAS